jgi:hypothetical protein
LKLSKTSWLMLSIGIFVVVAVGLGLTRSQQLNEQGRLDEELSVAEKRLNNLQVKELGQQQEELQRRLDEGTIRLMAAKDNLRQAVKSITVIDEFFEIAQSCSVEVMGISSSSIKQEKLEGIVCSAITLNAAVQGEALNLISFITKLNNDFTTGVVKSAQISIPEEASESEPSASVQMVVYAYEGD